MIAFIDMHRDQFGVELICRILRAAIPGFLTSRGYRAARTRPASDREIRDEQLIAELRTVLPPRSWRVPQAASGFGLDSLIS